MRIYLLRHGQSEGNAALTAEVDCGLTDVGAAQSAAAAAAVAAMGVTRILSSPYRRCLQTAETVRGATGAPAEFFPAVHEHHHDPFPPGPWPLPARAELAHRWPGFAVPADMPPQRWAAVPEDRPGQWRRIGAAVQHLLERFGGQADAGVAVVTHGAPASVFVQAFCQWQNPLRVSVHVDLGSVSILEVDPAGRRHLVRLNWLPEPAK